MKPVAHYFGQEPRTLPTGLQTMLEACLQGDSLAATQLVDRFRGQVFGLCFRMLRHQQDAEDMAQETFIRALKSLNKWDKTRAFEPWLMAIAGNRCRTLLAKRGRRPKSHGEVEDLPDNQPDISAAQQMAEEIELALGTIREEYRQAFLLFHERHLSYDQIAEMMACPLGTVKTWVHRARKEIVSSLRARGIVHEKKYAVPRT